MKSLIVAMVLASMAAVACPSQVLVKKAGAKTYYSVDLEQRYSNKEMTKFGCKPEAVVMSDNDKRALLTKEFNNKLAKLK